MERQPDGAEHLIKMPAHLRLQIEPGLPGIAGDWIEARDPDQFAFIAKRPGFAPVAHFPQNGPMNARFSAAEFGHIQQGCGSGDLQHQHPTL